MKKKSIVLLFSRGSPFVHECSANFRSLFAHFLCFLIKTARNRNFSLKIVIFFSFWILLYLSGSKFCPRGGKTFNFRTILANFHEYTLNMMSYHVTEAINGYF